MQVSLYMLNESIRRFINFDGESDTVGTVVTFMKRVICLSSLVCLFPPLPWIN